VRVHLPHDPTVAQQVCAWLSPEPVASVAGTGDPGPLRLTLALRASRMSVPLRRWSRDYWSRYRPATESRHQRCDSQSGVNGVVDCHRRTDDHRVRQHDDHCHR
jgi:hypothetical protein